MSDGAADHAKGFFDRAKTKEAIKELASRDQITIFVGAGASLDLQIPGWATLVSRLLSERITNDFDPGASLEAIAKEIVDMNFYQPTASIIDAMLFDHVDPTTGDYATRLRSMRKARNDRIAELIYANTKLCPFPKTPTLTGQILDLVAILKRKKRDVHIVTTNYDTAFEQAALTEPWLGRFSQLDYSLKSFSTRPNSGDIHIDHHIPVVHIHGTLPSPAFSQNLDRGNIVFSEQDYIDWEDTRFPDYVTERVSHGALLTVGASLRDNNVIARLHRGTLGRTEPRYALMPAEGDYAHLEKRGVSRQYWPSIVELSSRRGRLFSGTILRPDFYGQVFQFLKEVGLAVANEGEHYETYDLRIRRWAEEWRGRKEEDREFRKQVEDKAKLLAIEFEKIAPIEHCKVETWVRLDPDSRSIHRWCSSQSTWEHNVWRHSAKIEPLSTNVAVRSFTERANLHASHPDGNERWTHYMAVPVFLESKPWLDIPAGVIVAFFHYKSATQPMPEQIPELQHNSSTWFGRMNQFGQEALSLNPAS
ncbi:SIR2 family protein [Mycobacteroides abscessus]|uniref:SIR2 family protein n=1 Tax=Mycobacteroides abscessus TaxID=36809 RepID=UPI000E67A986|nr:SIR2 family protein [Mycobacteroides abscessus]RIR97820.1 SIR2 family protein [Mycobacteroides abscessus]